MNSADADDGTTLCTSCGMCCDGSIFAFVELDDADRSALAEAGQRIGERLDQPCPFLQSTCCSIYPARPKRCRAFRCEILQSVERGAIALPAALDLVAKARTRLAEIVGDLPPGTPIPHIARALPKPGTPAPPNQLAQLARYVAYRVFIERHFLPAPQRLVKREPVSRR